jgi:tape measure domain-containing protein
MAAAELKLQVGLDLAFFRQQLAQLGNVAVGYQLPINIKFDRLGIQQELNRLATNINRRKYRLEIATNIKSETEAAQKLDAALDNLQGKEVGIKITGTLGKIAPKDATKIRNDLAEAVAGGTGKKILVDVSVRENAIGEELRAVRKALNEKITPKNGKILVAASIRSGITNEEAKEFRESVKRKVGNIIVNVTGSADQLRAKEAKSIRTSLYQSIISNGGKIKIPATLTIADSEVAAFQKAVNSKFTGITVKVKAEIEEIRGGKAQAQIEKEAMAGWQRIQEMGAARMSGGSSDPARRESLRQSLSGRDIGELRSIGEQLGVKGARRYSNVQNLIEKIVADASIEMIKKYLDPQAVMRNPDRSGLGKVLDTFARGVFHMLGMDPAAMMAVQRQKLLPPSISWPASAATPPSYQSKPGTMLMGAPAPKGLGGTAFGAQKYLPAALGNETKKVLRDAANAFLDTIRQGIREVKVQDLGRSVAGQKVLPGKGIAGLLPPSIGRTPSIYATSGETQAELFARREKEARIKSAFREMDAMGGGAGRTAASYSYAYRTARPTSAIVPYGPGGALVAGGGAPPAPPSPPGPPNPPTPPGGRRGGFGSFGGLGGAMPNISLPGAGLVKEVGDQFGYAAQQVLLFGTTYKALAFLTDFPSKVGEAVAQLQSFRNTLQAITPNADEFQKSNQFILDTVDKYNIPIQSARDGFTKLYASMEPAGFSGEQIQKLFLGISKASATLGLSSDKVDRVTYAFSQMASKGQLMSEEVSGQLGDVIPGALSIMAEAANMDIKTFKKAMEDGVFVGKAFTDVMSNVPIVLEKRFGKGAEGAAKTFQGQMTAMANATKNLYEAFEPAGNLFASKIIAPFTKGLTVITDGFKAYFDGQRAVNPEAEKLNKILETLVPSLRGIAQNVVFAVKQLAPFAQVVGFVVLQISRLLALPFVRYLAATYLQVLLLTTAFNALATTGVTAAIASLAQFTKGMILHAGVAMGLTKVTQQSTFAMYQFGTAVQTVMIKSVIGIALVAIGALIARIVDLKGQLASIGNDAKGMEELAKSSAKIGDVQGTKEAFGNIEDRLKTIKELRKELSKATRIKTDSTFSDRGAISNSFKLPIKDDTAKKLIELGYISKEFLTKTADGYTILELNLEEVNAKIAAGEEAFSNATQKKNILIDQSIRKNKELKKSVFGAIPDPADDAKKANLESYYSLQDTLAKNAANFAAAQAEEGSRHRIELLERYYDIQETRANAYQKDAIRFEREMVMIEERRQEAKLKAQLDVQRAQSSVAGGAPGSGAGGTGAIFGDTGRTSNAAGFVHGHFQNQDREALVKDTVEVVMGLLSKGVSPELGSGARFASGMNVKQVEALVRKGIGSHKQYASGAGAVDIFVPKGTQVPAPVSGIKNLRGAAGVTGSLPRGSQLMHLDAASTMSASGGGMAPGKITGSEKRDAVAVQSTLQASIAKVTKGRIADANAVQEQIVAFEKYRAAAFPMTEQDLQNKLLTRRNELFRSGMTDERIDQEIKLYENQERGAAGLAVLDRLLTKKILTDTQHATLTKELNQDIANQNNLLQQNATLIGQSKFDQALKGLRDQIDMAKALTPEAEMRTRLQQQGYAGPQLETLFETEKAKVKAKELKTQMQGVASTIGDAFSTAFQGIINGSMSAQEALGNMFQSIGQSFVKMAMDMIAQQITMITLGFIMKALGLIGGIASAGNAAGAAAFSPGNAAGLDAIPGQAFSLPQLSGTMIDGSGFGAKAFAGPLAGGFAKGGAFSGGMRRFATGGIVNGPTLFPFADGGAMQMGLMGEAGPEAIMPLQRGADGALGVRAAMGGNGMGGSSSPILNMSFETSTINGVEYVSRDQLEAAMMQTRRQASSDGAKRGMAMTLDKIQQSPQTRRRIGM